MGRDVLLTDAACEVLRSLPGWREAVTCFSAGGARDICTNRILLGAGAGQGQAAAHPNSRSAAQLCQRGIGSGAGLYVVGKLLGHRSSRTTERYAHLSREARAEAVERAAAVLS